MRRTLLPLLLLLAACAAPTAPAAPAAPATPPPACRALPEPVVPQTAGTLGEQDGGRYCLALGAQVGVFLTGDAAGRWSAPVSSDRAVLAPVGTARLTAPLGVTPGVFRAARRGTAELASTLGGRHWQVTMVTN
ncbi:hypothetical protein CFP65_2471 [Kitasatospora sp. MMS16-BH015]|uniref:hypothetical protein n=1 Tax=Kitasatospora sp. MMS16-BH015 TaxID=2018025 RepID=UPI000CA3BBF4|nr:hypothetical protein [Kitasatospora sp. MMS16-BH015]AUG77303.1 hypothetical protein CFP65_2471 [Kitasatospora sp. MMS16-BH015]